MNIRDKILQYLTFGLFLFAPVVYWSHRLFPHISSKTFFVYGLVELIFFIWVYSLIINKSYRLHKKIIVGFIPAVAFVLWSTITGLLGPNFSMSFWSSLARGTGLLTLYHCLAMSFVVASMVQRNGISFVTKFIEYFMGGSFLLASSVWLGHNLFNIKWSGLQASNEGGMMGNSSLAAAYLIFSLALGLFLIFKKDFSKHKKYWLGFVMLVILFSPLFINLLTLFDNRGWVGSARGSVLALVVMTVTTLIFFACLHTKRMVRGIGLAGLVVGLATFIVLWMQLLNPTTYLHSKFEQEARGTRFIFWDIGSKGLSENPIIGYGPENYGILFQEEFNPDLLLEDNNKEGWDDRAHNIYYEIGSSGGYPAIVLYSIFILSFFVLIYKNKRKGNISAWQGAVLASVVVGYVFQNLFAFDSNLSLLVVYTLYGLLLGLLFYEGDHKFKNSNLKNKNLIILSLFVLFIICFVFFVYKPSHKSRLYAETFASTIDKRPEMYPALLKGPKVGENWDVSGLAFDSYREYVSSAIQLKNDKQLLPHLIKNLDSLLDYLYKVSEENKTDYRLYITISYLENTLTYMSDRQYTPELQERLLDVLSKAQELSPNNPNVYWSIAQAKVWGGDFTGTEEAFRQAMEVAPSLPGSYVLFMKYAQALGDKSLFNEILKQAQENIQDYEFTN